MTHDGSPRNGGVTRDSRDVYALSLPIVLQSDLEDCS